MGSKNPFEENLYAELAAANEYGDTGFETAIPFRFRLLADECVKPKTISYLEAAGYDVRRSPFGAQDPEVFKLATESQRVLFTYDYDFLNHDKYDPTQTWGVVVLPAYLGPNDKNIDYHKARDAALEYFSTKLPRAPCWWFYKKVVFRKNGEFDIQSVAPRLDRDMPYSPRSRQTYRYMKL